MKKIFLFIRNQYQVIFKGFLFIMAVAILVWIFPKEGLFKYEFSKGKPWLHEALYAPFDFAIIKTDEDIATEKLEALRGLPYYFKYIEKDTLLKGEDTQSGFLKYWEASVPDSLDNTEYRSRNLEVFNDLYSYFLKRGILDMIPELENIPPEYPIIVIRDNIAEEFDLEDLLTLNMAYELLQMKLAEAGEVETELLSTLITRFLEQNIVYDGDMRVITGGKGWIMLALGFGQAISIPSAWRW